MLINRIIGKVRRGISSIPDLYKREILRKAYLTKSHSISIVSDANEYPEQDGAVLSLAQELRTGIIDNYRHKYASKPYRFLLHLPESGVGIVWFKDLMQILEYTGIACTSVSYKDPAFKTIWNEFKPNVFISIDTAKMLRVLDLEFIRQYKQEHGCLRLFTPYPKHKFPNPGMSAEDQWRLELAKAGKSADAYFCMYVDEYFDMFLPEWVQAGFSYLALPHGCNPLYQYPHQGTKKYDYFMATSYGHERIRVTWEYMKPVFEKYAGLWAGPGWGFGLGRVNADKLPQYYAESKIVPNPLAAQLINYPMEITERTFSAMASGAFQITDWTPVTDRFFKENELIRVHGKDDFLEKFEYYLAHDEERTKILTAGMQRLYQEHTYFHRIDQLIAYVDELTTTGA